MPSRLARVPELIGWDGVLPLLMAAGPLVVKAMSADPPPGARVALVFAPPIAALVRAHIGWAQIARRCGGHAPLLRQVAMAIAIMLLFTFEAAVTLLTFEKRIPASAWWIPIGAYAGYLVVISYALRASRENAEETCESGMPAGWRAGNSPHDG